MNKKEMWRDVVGFEGYYKVSSLGRVASVRRKVYDGRWGKRTVGGAMLKQQTDRGGYRWVRLSKNGESFCRSVHRLVCESFIENPENKEEVNHKNCVKKDNFVSNLEWCTKSENQLHAYANGINKWDNKRTLKVSGEKSHSSKLKRNDVFQIRSIYEQGWVTQSEIADSYNVDSSLISRIINNEYWKHI